MVSARAPGSAMARRNAPTRSSAPRASRISSTVGAVLALEITGAPVDRNGVGSLLDLDAQAAEGIGAGGAGDAAHLAGEGHGAAAAGQPDAIGDVGDRPDLRELAS